MAPLPGPSAPPRRRVSLVFMVAVAAASMAALTLFNLYGVYAMGLSPARRSVGSERAAAALAQRRRSAEALEELLTLLQAPEVETEDGLAAETDVRDPRAAEKLLAHAKKLLADQRLRHERELGLGGGEQSSVSQQPPAESDGEAEPFPGDRDGSSMHIVFSTSCGQYNRVLQQTVLQQTATWVGQKGPITQILSGCSDEERAQVLQEPTFYYDFRRHFTPSFAINPEPGYEDNYSPYNKPFGLRHWLQNALPPVKHEAVALIDGDFFFFRPLEINTGRDVSRYYAGSRDPASVNDSVVDGWALAQDWTNVIKGGFYAAEKNETLRRVCGGLPCGDVSLADGVEFFANVGPPYVLTLGDARRFVDDYCHLCVTARTVSDEWMTEMFAYSVAAANHGIRHTALTNLGVSAPRFAPGGHEYWEFVDAAMANPCEDNTIVVMPRDPPVAVHTCQVIHNYYKAVIPGEVANCDCPLLENLPPTEWSELEQHVEEQYWTIRRQEVWVKCTLIKTMNRALTELKKRTCPKGYNTFRSAKAVS